MKKIILILTSLLLVLAAVGYGMYAVLINRTPSPAAQTTATETPSSFTNPFVDKPDTSFGQAVTPTPVNPFAQPTTAYQNPFAATNAGTQPYTNPFDALR